jgi:membrane protein DedA with SNARE-associated domain
MNVWLSQLISILPDGGSYLAAIFIVAFFESLPMIGLLMPGSTLVVMAGFLVFHGKSSLLLLFIISTSGALAGDLVSFWLGFRFGSKILKTKSFQKHYRLITKSEQFFVNHGGKSIFFARFLGPIRGITPFIAGLSGMARNTFYYYAFISAIFWGITYPGLGYMGGHSWQYAQSLTTRFGLGMLIILAAVFIHQWVRKNIKP